MSYDGNNPDYDSIDLEPLSSPPINPVSGTVFYSNVSGLIGYDGSSWGKLDVASLPELNDVDLSGGATAGDILTYDGSNWIASGVVPDNLSDLDDVSGSPTSGQYLGYNGSIWTPQTLTPGPSSIGGLDDVNIDGISNGDYLVYNSASGEFLATSPSLTLDDLTDVTITSPATDSALQYNGSIWIDSAATVGQGDSFLTLETDIDETAGYISGITVSGSLNSHNNWFFIATDIQNESVRNVHFRFANAGTDRITLYDNSFRRRATTSASDGNSATSNDNGVDCGGFASWASNTRGMIMGWLTRWSDSVNGKWMGRIITQVGGGLYYTENVFNWDADETIDSFRLYSNASSNATENGRIKGRVRLYRIG